MTANPLARIEGNEWRLTPAGYGAKLSGGLWEPAAHLELLSQKFVETAFHRNRGRLIVSMPPRHGKSEHSSHYGPVWYEDLFPERYFGLATYGADYSREWGEKIRETIREHPELLRMRLRRAMQSSKHLGFTAGGGLYAVGVRGMLTGRGVHALGIDDPHKDWEEANSVVFRDKAWNWYGSTARTRLNPVRDPRDPKPFVVVTMTRWHEDDLAGRLIEEQGVYGVKTEKHPNGGLWEVINLPAICEDPDSDPLGRRAGEALWPEMWPVEVLEDTRVEVGPYVWEALYQGRPSPPEGTILLRRWWRYYDAWPTALDVDGLFQSWDMSFKESEGSDFVCGQVWAVRGPNRILVDLVKERASFTKTCELVKAMSAKWPGAQAKFVEDSANGPAVIDALQSTVGGFIPVTAEGSKVSRAQATTPFLAAGNIYIPSPRLAPWVEDFVRECAVFPKAPNDDQVDAYTQAMIQSGLSSPVMMGGYQPHERAGRR